MADTDSKLDRLKAFLEQDANNLGLLRDCAAAALAEGDPVEAAGFYVRIDAIEPLAGAEANIAGITAMRAGDQKRAQNWFDTAATDDSEDLAVQFNIAWSKALEKDFASSSKLLTPDLIATLPQAAMLDLQIAHELGQFDKAERKLDEYLEMHPSYGPLQAAASVLAMDVDRPDLARKSAEAAGDHPDALVTLGTLDLGERKFADARDQFKEALATRPFNPRAQIGLGLIDLAEGNPRGAAKQLDKGAEQFGDHLGSWIAAGWAHLLAGDIGQAQKRFEAALAHDDNFGEAQGSLAVVELLQGATDAARRRLEVARRLDAASFSTALGAMLLEQQEGDPAKAEQIFRIAAKQPILPDGSTLMDELVKSLVKN